MAGRGYVHPVWEVLWQPNLLVFQRQKGYTMIDYINDYVGMGVPRAMSKSYDALMQVMQELGFTTIRKKLFPPETQVTCLGILIDTIKGTIAILPENLEQIN